MLNNFFLTLTAFPACAITAGKTLKIMTEDNKEYQRLICVDPNPNDEIAKIIYTNIYARDHRGVYREWDTAVYQAPETHEGFAYKICLDVANKIRAIK